MADHTSLKNKVALITGGGTGIGQGIALALAKEQARVVISGRRKDRLENTIEQVWQIGAGGLAVPADVGEAAEIEKLVALVVENYGRIDILINNAGVYIDTAVHETTVESWDEVMATNLRAPFLLTRAVLPMMRAQRSGHIINISSESGLSYDPDDTVYGVSKHALNDFGEYVQRENQDFNIRVNTVCPGMVVTEMTQDSIGLDHSKCLFPEDIADLVIWLLTRRQNIKIGAPILIQTMLNPWE